MLNLTPHPLTIRSSDGTDTTILPSGTIARVATVETHVGTALGVQVIARTWAEVEGLPDEGTPCLVSALVLDRVPGRAGVYAPDTGKTAIRDDSGRIVAVTRLITA